MEVGLSLKIEICDTRFDTSELAAFFCANLTRSYISHSEMQSARTASSGDWAADIEQQFAAELDECVRQSQQDRSTVTSWNGAVVATLNGRLAGLAMLAYGRDAPIPYGTIEDIVVDSTLRGQGIGSKMMDWIIQDMQKNGLGRAFLESGAGNTSAHDLFHRMGFDTISVVMLKDI